MSIQFYAREASPLLLFGLLLLGGLASGEISRRACRLPRTTGYVLFGVLIGNSGLHWIDPYILDAAQFFIYPGIGLILFELGHHFPLTGRRIDRRLVGRVQDLAPVVAGGIDPGPADEDLAAPNAEILRLLDVHRCFSLDGVGVPSAIVAGSERGNAAPPTGH